MLISIREDQLEAAKALVQHAYSNQLPSDASPALLIQICTLADQEDMVAAQEAACLAMAAIEPMPEEILRLSFKEPLPGLVGTRAWNQLQQVAASALQQRYGDLEKVLNTPELEKSFKQLPFEALLRLLKHEGTRVAMEGTVCLAVDVWWHAQPRGEVSREQLRQLAAEVRFAGMSSIYRHRHLEQVTWLTKIAMTRSELIEVLSYFQLYQQQQQARRWGEGATEQQLKNWVQRAPRLMSSYLPSVQVEASMQQLQQVHQTTTISQGSVWWGGRVCALLMHCEVSGPYRRYGLMGTVAHSSSGRLEASHEVGFAADFECLTAPAGVPGYQGTLEGMGPLRFSLAVMQDWEPEKLQQYATSNKLKFRVNLRQMYM